MGNKLVSVAIPCYKGKYLAETIASVLAQTYPRLELIIVNDCSADNIDSIVTQFSDPRIRYYTNEKNLGKENPAHNWNRCLTYATGEYFALLCDDDLYAPNFLEQMVALAEKYPQVNVFRARANFIDATGKEINKYASAPEWESMKDYLWHVCRNYRSQTISEWFYRRPVIEDNGGYALLPIAWYADYLSIFRFSRIGGIASSSDILVHFRQSGLNISSQDDKNTELKIVAAREFRNEMEKLLADYPDCDYMLGSLDWLLRLHLRYNLNHARKSVLWRLYSKRKQLGLRGGMLWHAFWHKEKE